MCVCVCVVTSSSSRLSFSNHRFLKRPPPSGCASIVFFPMGNWEWALVMPEVSIPIKWETVAMLEGSIPIKAEAAADDDDDYNDHDRGGALTKEQMLREFAHDEDALPLTAMQKWFCLRAQAANDTGAVVAAAAARPWRGPRQKRRRRPQTWHKLASGWILHDKNKGKRRKGDQSKLARWGNRLTVKALAEKGPLYYVVMGD